MDKIKICELCDAYYPAVDGVVNVVKNYSKELNKISECKACVPSAGKKSGYVDNEEFEIFRCRSMSAPEGYRNALPFLDGKLKKKLYAEKFDIVHTHSPFGMGRLALKIARKNGIPVVATLHTQYKQDFERSLKGFKPLVNFMMRYIMKVYNKADSVWTVSNVSCDVLRSYGYKGDIKVIRNGTDLFYPENAEELKNKIDERHGLKGQKNVFAFVGRMAMYKNLKLLCDSLKIAKDAGCDFKMLFVGGGFDLPELKEYAKSVGIEDKCIFTGPVKERSELQAYYVRSDLVLFPSTFDTSSIVGIEAAAHKVACVMINGCGTAEALTDGVDGFLTEETAESFGAKIIELCANPELMKKAGELAYKNIYRSWGDVAREVYENYQKVIEEYKSRREEKKNKKKKK